MIARLLCWLTGHPAYRRARKGEDRDRKFCVRCSAPAIVRKRKVKAADVGAEA